MVGYDPDDAGWWILWAQATSKAESIDAGRLILVNALERHPHDASVRQELTGGKSAELLSGLFFGFRKPL